MDKKQLGNLLKNKNIIGSNGDSINTLEDLQSELLNNFLKLAVEYSTTRIDISTIFRSESPIHRPEILYGITQKVKTGLGTLYLTINELDNKPIEVIATIGKSGQSITAKAEAICRMVTLALKNHIDVKTIVKQLKGIGGEHPVYQNNGLQLSIPDAIANLLEEMYLNKK